jgi:DNA-binding MarR family transcriptional regulator
MDTPPETRELIKNLIEKGYVKAKRAQRKKLRYIITPEGLAFRARLTVNYVENSMHLYRRTRKRAMELLTEAQAQGFESVRLTADGDLAEICRLTCMEQGVGISDDPSLPVLAVRGWKVYLDPGSEA